MQTTLKKGSGFGKQNKGFTITSVDRKNGVYHASWDGQFFRPRGNGEFTVFWCPDVVIDIEEFERLNNDYIEEGVMAYLRVTMLSDYLEK